MWNISTIYISSHQQASVARAIPRVQLQPRSETVQKALWHGWGWFSFIGLRKPITASLSGLTARHRSCACLTLPLWKYRTTFNFAMKKKTAIQMYQYRLILSLDKETSTLLYQAALPRKPWKKYYKWIRGKQKTVSDKTEISSLSVWGYHRQPSISYMGCSTQTYACKPFRSYSWSVRNFSLTHWLNTWLILLIKQIFIFTSKTRSGRSLKTV